MREFCPKIQKIEISGGGSNNVHLISQIKTGLPDVQITIGNTEYQNFREAIGFAILGQNFRQNKKNLIFVF